MAFVKSHICNIHNCKNEAFYIKRKMQIIFISDPDDGSIISPEFYNVEIDICEFCLKKILKGKKYIVATGSIPNFKFNI